MYRHYRKYNLLMWKTHYLLNTWSDLDPSVIKTDYRVIIFETMPSAETLITFVFSLDSYFIKVKLEIFSKFVINIKCKYF